MHVFPLLARGDFLALVILLTWSEEGVMDLIWQSGFFAKAIMLSLLLLSIIAWSITLNKYWQFRGFHREFFRLINLLRPNTDMAQIYNKFTKSERGPLSRIFDEGYLTLSAVLNPNAPERSRSYPEPQVEPGTSPPGASANHRIEQELALRLETATEVELSQMETGLAFLSTVITVSPFLGLLGTVWGVMQAFLSIGRVGSADLAVVAPGIAEALITTVAGLAVAIPAVLCHNFLATRLRLVEEDLGRIKTELQIHLFSYWHREKSKIENRFGHQRDVAR